MTDPRDARSWLFVPGDRPERFDKAVAAGPDLVVVDLEDAVALPDKERARTSVAEWLARGGRAVVRINGSATSQHPADLELAADTGSPILLPKTESADELDAVAAALPANTPIIALIESAAGLLAAPAICAHPRVVRAAFGSIDLALDLGVDPADGTALVYARQALVVAARAAGFGPVDGIWAAIDDELGLVADLVRGTRLGFTGKLCIHPRQVDTVHAGFIPPPDQVAWAERVLASSSSGAALLLDGEMVDAPVLRRAQMILDRAGQARWK